MSLPVQMYMCRYRFLEVVSSVNVTARLPLHPQTQMLRLQLFISSDAVSSQVEAASSAFDATTAVVAAAAVAAAAVAA